MSLPIPICWMFKAAKGDEKAYKALKSRLKYNMNWGHFSIWPCEHDPKCQEATDAEMEALDERLDPPPKIDWDKADEAEAFRGPLAVPKGRRVPRRNPREKPK